jgi:hypothetical protein
MIMETIDKIVLVITRVTDLVADIALNLQLRAVRNRVIFTAIDLVHVRCFNQHQKGNLMVVRHKNRNYSLRNRNKIK